MDGEADATVIGKTPALLVKSPSNIVTAIIAGIFATPMQEWAERLPHARYIHDPPGHKFISYYGGSGLSFAQRSEARARAPLVVPDCTLGPASAFPASGRPPPITDARD